jgi:hypothetical protein
LLTVSRVDRRTVGGLNMHLFATCQRILGKLHLTIRKSKQGMVPVMPTKSPGCNRVPRCRTMMFPGITFCPPYFLTPGFLGFESRPFCVEPPAFFVAHLLNIQLAPPTPSLPTTSVLQLVGSNDTASENRLASCATGISSACCPSSTSTLVFSALQNLSWELPLPTAATPPASPFLENAPPGRRGSQGDVVCKGSSHTDPCSGLSKTSSSAATAISAPLREQQKRVGSNAPPPLRTCFKSPSPAPIPTLAPVATDDVGTAGRTNSRSKRSGSEGPSILATSLVHPSESSRSSREYPPSLVHRWHLSKNPHSRLEPVGTCTNPHSRCNPPKRCTPL